MSVSSLLRYLLVVAGWVSFAGTANAQGAPVPTAGSVARDESSPPTQNPRETIRLSTALEVTRLARELDVDWLGTSQSDVSRQWGSRLTLGAAYGLPFLGRRVVGVTEGGIGLHFDQGHWPVHLRERVFARFGLTPVVALHLGGVAGLHVNASDVAFSYLDLGFDVAIAFGSVELSYMPTFGVPLGAEERAVLDGRSRDRIRPGAAVHSVALRISFPVGRDGSD